MATGTGTGAETHWLFLLRLKLMNILMYFSSFDISEVCLELFSVSFHNFRIFFTARSCGGFFFRSSSTSFFPLWGFIPFECSSVERRDQNIVFAGSGLIVMTTLSWASKLEFIGCIRPKKRRVENITQESPAWKKSSTRWNFFSKIHFSQEHFLESFVGFLDRW